MLHRYTFFYADDGLVAWTDPVWLQGPFDTLTGLFDRVGLRKNAYKTVSMIFRPFQEAGTHLEGAYKWRVMGKGLTYRSRQRLIIQYPQFCEELVAGSLAVHRQTQHGVDAGGINQWETPPPDGDPQTYRMEFQNTAGP